MGLTEREVAVLEFRQQGLTQAEVAKRLKISQAAVSSFEQNAHHKLRDAQDMLAFAKHAGITPAPPPAYQQRGVRR